MRCSRSGRLPWWRSLRPKPRCRHGWLSRPGQWRRHYSGLPLLHCRSERSRQLPRSQCPSQAYSDQSQPLARLKPWSRRHRCHPRRQSLRPKFLPHWHRYPARKRPLRTLWSRSQWPLCCWRMQQSYCRWQLSSRLLPARHCPRRRSPCQWHPCRCRWLWIERRWLLPCCPWPWLGRRWPTRHSRWQRHWLRPQWPVRCSWPYLRRWRFRLHPRLAPQRMQCRCNSRRSSAASAPHRPG
jgi:hypothetical protein